MRDFRMFGNPYVSLCVYVGLNLCSCLHFEYINLSFMSRHNIQIYVKLGNLTLCTHYEFHVVYKQLDNFLSVYATFSIPWVYYF
jgi:hypothetical protein